MLPQDNMAPGQQNHPDETGNTGRKTSPGEEILSGAQQQDQLDSFKKNAQNNPSHNSQGTAPGAHQRERQTEDGLALNNVNNDPNS